MISFRTWPLWSPAHPITEETQGVFGESGTVGPNPRALPDSRRRHAAGSNRLVQVDIAIANLEVEPTTRIDADPCFVMNGRALTAIIGQGNQRPDITFQTFGYPPLFHVILLPNRIRDEYTTCYFRVTSNSRAAINHFD